DGTIVDDGQGNLTASSGNFTPDTAGTYFWEASYDPVANNDANNNAFGPTDCGDLTGENHEQSIVSDLSVTKKADDSRVEIGNPAFAKADNHGEVQGSDSIQVLHPNLLVVKDGAPPVVHDGDQVTFTYNVTNPGSDPVTVDSISDDKCSPIADPTKFGAADK